LDDNAFPTGKDEIAFQSLLDRTEDANRICRVLANHTRLKILCFVANGEKTVNEIRTFTREQQPTVSQQLARLRNYGLVVSRREGKTVFYKLRSSRTRGILECLEGIVQPGSGVPTCGGD